MFPVARGLPFSLRAGLRTSRLRLTPRPLLFPKSPSPLGALRQFSSTPPQNRQYFRFDVDPEQPLNYRKWSTGTQVFGGIVVLALAYYLSQYVPSSLRRAPGECPLSHTSPVSRPCQKRVDGDSWTSAQSSRSGYVRATGRI